MSGMTLLRATRPNFLLLALLCATLGIVLTGRQLPVMQGTQLMLVLLGAVLAHAAVNLLNEYQDFRSGLDLITQRTPFSGGSGALPENPEAAAQVLVSGLAPGLPKPTTVAPPIDCRTGPSKPAGIRRLTGPVVNSLAWTAPANRNAASRKDVSSFMGSPAPPCGLCE